MEREIEIRLTSVNVRRLEDFFAIPGIHVLFMGPVTCMRHGFGDILQADYRQISHLCISEVDMVTGLYLQRVDEAIGQIAARGDVRAVIFKAGCQNAIIGTDYRFLTSNAESKYGLQARLYEMNKMSTKKRRFGSDIAEAPFEIVYSLLADNPGSEFPSRSVNLLGGIRKLAAANEMKTILEAQGYELKYIHACKSYDDFQSFKHSALNLVLEDGYEGVADKLFHKFGIPFLPFYDSVSVQEVGENYRELSRLLQIPIDVSLYEQETRAEIKETLDLLADCSLTIKAANYFTPLKFAYDLAEYGFKVGKVLKRQMFFQNPEEEYLARLEERVPGIMIGPDTWPEDRPRGKNLRKISPAPGPLSDPLSPGEDYLGFSRICSVMRELREKYRLEQEDLA